MLLEEGDQVAELLVVELLGIRLRHDPRLEALRDLGIGVHDRLVDELLVLPLEDLVEIRANLR